MTPTPRSIVICDTCRIHYSEHTRYLDNHAAALDCINAGHDTYASGIARLQLPTLKHHQPAHTHQPPLTLF